MSETRAYANIDAIPEPLRDAPHREERGGFVLFSGDGPLGSHRGHPATAIELSELTRDPNAPSETRPCRG